MAFDWYVASSPSSIKNKLNLLPQTYTAIRDNDDQTLKNLIQNGDVDCDARVQTKGSSYALIMLAVDYNHLNCGKG